MLFTEPVARLTLADLLAKGPQQTGELMTRAVVELAGLQQPAVARAVDAAAIAERRIGSTFDRKFNGISGPTYLRKAGQAGEALSTVVLRLRLRLRLRRLRPAPTAGHLLPVIYGALKPDHVVFPVGADGRPVFLDPGLGRGRPQTDAAKLISRTVLGLIAASPDLAAADATAPGIEEFADTLTATRPGRAGRVAAAPGGAVAHGHHQHPQHLPHLPARPAPARARRKAHRPRGDGVRPAGDHDRWPCCWDGPAGGVAARPGRRREGGDGAQFLVNGGEFVAQICGGGEAGNHTERPGDALRSPDQRQLSAWQVLLDCGA
ncbi:hypothetical protein [Streptomyces noursei]|uniref:hypothetical protein n=1 Tax=Streptomyces noursei TaxID=1971 RepID=UPI00196568FD|nr:hypothetical protein [Streptomyces noursei]QRX96427.1 hypothetical protein JNO44_41575 [Streptomyces noursei]